MALSNFHNLGLDVCLGLGSSSSSSIRCSSSRVGSSGVKQRRNVAVKRRLFELQAFHFSERCLVWSSSWGGLLHAAGNGESALLGSQGQGQGQGRSGTAFGSEIENERRLHSQHHSRIAASNSSSREVDAAAESWGSKPRYDDSGKGVKFQEQSSLREPETLSGGWESEQDHSEAEYAERNHSGEFTSTSDSEDYFEGNIGGVRGESIDDSSGEEARERNGTPIDESPPSSSSTSASASPSGAHGVGPKEPVYEVIEVSHFGKAVKKLVSRRQLLRTSGLRLRDLRRVDPSLWVTNSAPALLVRDQAILLNLGSLRAIATTQEVLIFDQQSKGAQSFIGTLVPRLNDHHNGSVMPFELEVIESALISRTQRLEKALMDVEPRVLKLLEVLPTCMTADVLEELRVSKQALVEVGSKAGALRQMLLELLEHPQDIRRMVIMGRICSLGADGKSVDCLVPQDKQVAEDEEEEMEMLLEYYLQRCESTHGQSLKLLSSAKEMEDSIAVNLSSRRLEVSRLELLLQVGTFCAALGALVAGIFGMNLKSYLEERALAFWFTTGGIIFGGIALFLYMFSYLSNRKIL